MLCIKQHFYLIMKNNLYTLTYIKADKYISLQNLMIFMLQKLVLYYALFHDIAQSIFLTIKSC